MGFFGFFIFYCKYKFSVFLLITFFEDIYHENRFNYTKYELSYININFLYHILNPKETKIFGHRFFIRFTRVLSSNMQGYDIRFKNSKSNFSFVA